MAALIDAEITRQLSDMVLKAGANLFKATKYLYALTDENYYHCDIKDFFKVILNNIFNTDTLSAFQISFDGDADSPLNSREYFNVFRLMIYSFAVRLPVLCRLNAGGRLLNVKQIDAIYNAVMEKGISDCGIEIAERYEDIMASVRKGKSVTPYNTEWFRTYIYSSVPELASISNRNFYFMGAVDVLIPLYYICLEKEFENLLNTLVITKETSP